MTGQGKTGIDSALAESLKELALEHPFEKITIKEITARAGVIRPTFYNHFQDKYELLEWIIREELLDPMRPLITNGMIREAMVLIFTNMERDKAFYTRVVRMEGAVTFADVANRCVEEMLFQVITEAMSGKKHKRAWLTPEFISRYYAQSMCFSVIDWINTGMKLSPQEMAEAYQYIISHSMDQVVEDL